ncbi:proline-serine-threonine phosphatase-interacting protein 2 isoform X1 [Lingula anatina]|uniref:Proline-serine-threonine phosphatase-interacting protein 2 isoform X1 n=1 Tax=Lingula anatina TaxID=7574 RepID=A0A1S3JXN0_LINAN|nr:proline-serine-threonine phosphatase-interacting protein 2 isoform X1 [Lingula anatina]|eukprot:XP_013415067.1 proline-serine-threonine phosphatase-interacting protein 2 isoform X1 [Lingula anatina]
MTKLKKFSDAFWGTEFCSTLGFDTVCRRLKDGRQMVKDVEDFLKQRAKIEEDYQKNLINLTKKAGGATENGTLRASWEELKSRTEAMANAHLEFSRELNKEVERLNQFMTKQKDERKQVEDTMKKVQTNKISLYHKTIQSKKNYESKCRNCDEAHEQYLSLNSQPNIQAKEIQKSKTKYEKAKTERDQADLMYRSSIDSLDGARREWEKEMELACNVTQKMEEERIGFLRNELWMHINFISQLCVEVDDHCEVVRLSLEKCEEEADIMAFIEDKKTGTRRPDPIVYERYQQSWGGNGNRVTTLSRRPPEPLPGDNRHHDFRTMPNPKRPPPPVGVSSATFFVSEGTDSGDGLYASVNEIYPDKRKTYQIIKKFEAKDKGEITVLQNEIVEILDRRQGYVHGKVLNRPHAHNVKGWFPADCVSTEEVSLI